MTRKPTHIAASVSQRLLQRSQRLGEDYQLTLQRYAIERLLFRLSQSPAHDRFVLKGAMLYLVWGGEIYRPTRDLDLLGYGADTAEAMNDCFRSFCSIEVKDDGLVFPPDTVCSEKIRDGHGKAYRIEAPRGRGARRSQQVTSKRIPPLIVSSPQGWKACVSTSPGRTVASVATAGRS